MHYERLSKVTMLVAFNMQEPFGALDAMIDDLQKLQESNDWYYTIINVEERELEVTEKENR